MDCQESRDWLLDADDPRPAACPDPEIAAHLARCPACQALSADLLKLANAWRAIPLPPGADAARLAFLDRLPAPTLRLARPRRQPVRRPRMLAAAMVLFGVGLAMWFLVPPPEAHAGPALIERLVDWNLDLARATTASERSRVYANRRGDLNLDVVRAPLPEADRALANLLLDNGSWLATHDDPIAAAERFSAVADRLVERMQRASERKELHLANRYARLQALVGERGVADSLEKAEASGALNFEQRRHLEKIILSDEGRMKALVELLERNPNLSRKDIRRAIDPKPKKATKRPDAARKQKPSPTRGDSVQP